MIDYKRLLLNLLFFFLGILIPLLAFQSAFAECVLVPHATGSEPDLYLELPAGIDSPWIYQSYSTSPWNQPETIYTGSGGSVTNVSRWVQAGSIYRIYWLATASQCTPEPEIPEHCTNGVKDEDETGINCGEVVHRFVLIFVQKEQKNL